MKRVVVLLVLGILAPILQGAAVRFVPAHAFPDLGLLLVVALGLCWRSLAGGLLLVGAMGYVADLLSGSLLGQHMLLRLVAFGAARSSSRHLNLRGALPQAVFVAGLTAANALALGALTAFFAPGADLPLVALDTLIPHMIVNSVCAPLVAFGVAQIVSRLGDEEGGHRLLRLEPRSWSP